MEFENTPVYVRDCDPGWFVPNQGGDKLLQSALENGCPDSLAALHFRHRLPTGGKSTYSGRDRHLDTNHLRELWFHLTNRCNLACRHCLFASSPSEKLELATEKVLGLVDEACALGCRVFVLTGGEPFIHPGFSEIVEAILAHPKTHVVVLTNGTCLAQNREKIIRWGSDRFHLQISVDGLSPRHDAIRGAGAFEKLKKDLQGLKEIGFPFTVSMCVDAGNVDDMAGVVETAAELGASNVHYMWLFIKGRASKDRFAPVERIFESLRKADNTAQKMGITLDNIEAFKTQVFAPAGTIHDGCTSGWESAAIGPDGALYPSAALVGVNELATPLQESLKSGWQKSRILNRIRETSAAVLDDPLRFIVGGGDIDHSYTFGGTFVGDDPYWPLYRKIVLWLITREARPALDDSRPALRLKMGDVLKSCGAHGPVAHVHSNCLLATAQTDSFISVKEYYSEAAHNTKEDILNPVCYPDNMLAHIPEELRFRGYGCGSPIADADLQPGQTVVDLGCGHGVECFIAARQVGKTGRVIGIDMLDPMLEKSRTGAKAVAARLGYNNLEFKKGYLENLPLEDNSAERIVSNCVLNLSSHKRKTFSEILRVLKPGGRLVVSDVVCEVEPDAAIRNDEILRGECIAGAMTHRDLIGILEESGFHGFRLIKRMPYRDIREHRFFSITYEATKPVTDGLVSVIYRGPLRAVQSAGGQILFAGMPARLPKNEAERLGPQLVILDSNGMAVNQEWENSCCCAIAPDTEYDDQSCSCREESTTHPLPVVITGKKMSDCMVCGAALIYLTQEREQECHYCGTTSYANAICKNGHFVCDTCHSAEALALIEHLCQSADKTDMLELMQEIRTHPAIPIHGPEHHALVPGIILTTFRNLGGNVSDQMLATAIRRSSQVAGGSCGFSGICGAATGVGVAFSLILDANPLKHQERQAVMNVVNRVSRKIAENEAARCCQRESWIALKQAAEISGAILPLQLQANAEYRCLQKSQNQYCIGKACPLGD